MHLQSVAARHRTLEYAAMMKFSTPRIRLPRPKKRFVIIAIAVVVVLALAAYGFFSYTTWHNLDQESKQVATSLKTAVNASLGTEKEHLSPTTEIKKLISDFDKKYSGSPCRLSPWISWQMVIPQAKSIAAGCDERFFNSLEFISHLKIMVGFIEEETQANTLLSTSIEATKAPKDYASASTTWKSTADSPDLVDRGNFQPVADKIKEVSTAISTAYASLATALKDEDKAGLDKAIKDLEAAYASIGDISAVTTSTRQPLIANIAEAYDKL